MWKIKIIKIKAYHENNCYFLFLFGLKKICFFLYLTNSYWILINLIFQYHLLESAQKKVFIYIYIYIYGFIVKVQNILQWYENGNEILLFQFNQGLLDSLNDNTRGLCFFNDIVHKINIVNFLIYSYFLLLSSVPFNVGVVVRTVNHL